MSYHVLVVDDDSFQCKTIQLTIEKFLRFRVSTLTSPMEAVDLLLSERGNDIDMVILDLSMPDMDGLEVLDKVHPQRPDLPIIINTAYGDITKAVKAVQKGAVDFIEKQDGPERMKLSIENVRKISNLKKQVDSLDRFSKNIYSFNDIVGHSKTLKRTINTADKASRSNIPVLLRGESGVGKELFARAIHSNSIRNEKPFVAVNCSAIPENLVESVLFGHEKGAFTGAIERSIGKFREANGGTIFLDEIGELSLDTQAKLLRVLQNFEIEPIGAGKSFDVNVRIISATNKNLEKAVEAGLFREDLFYRINVLGINIPPLRDRKDDIKLLVNYFIEKICARESLPVFDFTDDVISLLEEYRWPGNVRQLENTIYKAIVLNEGNILGVEDFDSILRAMNLNSPLLTEGLNLGCFNPERGKFKTINEYEKDIIENALEFYNWNISRVSKILDIGRSTLYRKMKEYGIEESSNVEDFSAFKENRKKN